MKILLILAIAMAGGLALSRLMKLLNLPNVTGYLIAGILTLSQQLWVWRWQHAKQATKTAT